MPPSPRPSLAGATAATVEDGLSHDNEDDEEEEDAEAGEKAKGDVAGASLQRRSPSAVVALRPRMTELTSVSPRLWATMRTTPSVVLARRSTSCSTPSRVDVTTTRPALPGTHTASRTEALCPEM
jgi:hypothetical protein